MEDFDEALDNEGESVKYVVVSAKGFTALQLSISDYNPSIDHYCRTSNTILYRWIEVLRSRSLSGYDFDVITREKDEV
ncbi:MAG: hypothetical protein OMM_12158 [Candidatus Magnetoglobus multicellularis str. Araruama]|uniref:Uncharacterized protein n=1 Tax=Candidatus Magnetoglobus multicellularis str. Araruama TaxID=890399 RepID=A0A1V1NWG3_9BACT|nr:MAG: hypothetical protein OMM_12158 [Candidatus Magnetoglobus multicellularis str. Araruama]